MNKVFVIQEILKRINTLKWIATGKFTTWLVVTARKVIQTYPRDTFIRKLIK